jgi:2-iminobutanoate/2-iminopropanoate deaminase
MISCPSSRPPRLDRRLSSARVTHHRRVIEAAGAPAAAGPYSHGIVAGGLLFCSGQIALDVETGELVDGDVARQATVCLGNLAAVCEAAGARLEDAVRLTVHLIDLPSEAAAVNDVYASFFSDVASELPARTAIGVSALPRGARVMIDAIVALPD